MTTLKDVAIGRKARVVKVGGEGALRRRIMDMGLTKGVTVYVRKVAPLGDPIEITIRGYELSLRKADAEMIEVELIDEEQPAHGRGKKNHTEHNIESEIEQETELKIALAGNPNCGKTTLFNALTGSNQYVGNWPGVTVEHKEGRYRKNVNIIITDLPGIYSLSPYTLEEVVARNYLIDERPDAILNIVDGMNLERNLYLTTQLLEIGIPVVVAINMMDMVRKSGDEIDLEALSRSLKCRVIEISALTGENIQEAAALAVAAAKAGALVPPHTFSGSVEHAIAHIEEAVIHDMPDDQQRWYAIKIFERDSKVLERLNIPKDILAHIEKDIEACENEMDDDAEAIITNERYLDIDHIIRHCYKKRNIGRITPSGKIDRVVTNRWLALPIFAAVMFIVYYVSVSLVGKYATQWMSDGVFGDGWRFFGIDVPGIPALVGNFLASVNCAPWLQGLILDGIVAGVGAVLSFAPQMFVLFLFLALLEDCGYMSRIAFVLDKIFRKFGLSGKSFIAFLVGTGCSVPGIMTSRTVETERERRMTIITTSFIPCGAKLPFIALIAGALFGGSPWVAPAAYFLGIAAVIISGLILKKFGAFAGKESPFVMELPAYHRPLMKNVLKTMWDRGWAFIKKAGTIILLSSVVLWFTTYFGWAEDGFRMLATDEVSCSILARIGGAIAVIFKPLGFGNWQATVASIAGLLAKENIVSSLSIFYSAGAGVYARMAEVFTPVSGFAFMIFNLLCAPCVAAMGAIRSEMKSGKWFFLAIGYQTVFAYSIALIWNQIGGALTGSLNMPGLIAAIITLALLLGLIFRTSRSEEHGHHRKGA